MAWAANPIRLMLDGARRKSQRRGGGGNWGCGCLVSDSRLFVNEGLSG